MALESHGALPMRSYDAFKACMAASGQVAGVSVSIYTSRASHLRRISQTEKQYSCQSTMLRLASAPFFTPERATAQARYRYTDEDPSSRSRYSRSMSDSMRFFKSGGLIGNLSCWNNSDMSNECGRVLRAFMIRTIAASI